MEFFHAKIYWSGYGEVITNVNGIPSENGGKITELNGANAILCISLEDTEIIKLRNYLDREFGKTVKDEDFEKYMEMAFYNGSPLDSFFDIAKFMQICAQLQITPSMNYYQYRKLC